MNVDLKLIEETAKDLYIRALKILPDDVKKGFDRLARTETNPRAKAILGTMIPMAGIYCYGEIGPVRGVETSRYFNETFVTLLLGT